MDRIDFNALRTRVLAELLYCAESGAFTRISGKRGTQLGRPAGWQENNGYWRIRVMGRKWPAHHLAWLVSYGELPPVGMEIDHINHIRTDNRLSNLRLATRQQNSRNAKQYRSKRAVCGVSKMGSKWQAGITVDGRFICLGTFPTTKEAAACRAEANKKHGFHLNHGK